VLIESHELDPGAVVRSKYRIVSKIGQGGMGVVYLADNILMNVRVALKFLAGELGRDPRFIKRFRNEARMMFLLRHPNVAQVHDLDQAEDGSLFLAMEYVDGPSLRAVIDSAPHGLPIPAALALVRGIAAGLGAAHERGTVHRDIKPENILLTKDGHQPKVLDFGIAAAKEGATAMSRTGGPLFTPEYAAPEQWKGMASTDLDGRTDIYALGGVFYELLTGQTPLHAHNIQGWMYQHLSETPVPPSQHRSDLRAHPGLDELVLSMLAKERERRPGTISDFLNRLDSLGQRNSSAGRTVVEPQVTPPYEPPPVVPPPPPFIPPESKPSSGKWVGIGLVAVPIVVLVLVFATRSGGSTADPVLSPSGGTYAARQPISITDATSDAVIHYTTDGSTPTEISPTYSDPLQNLPSNAMVRAIAIASGHKPSHDVSGTYVWTFDQAKTAWENKQYGEARGLFKQACDGGDKLSCNYLAYDYANGLGGAANPELAQSLYKKSCEDGVMKSCASLGSIYETKGDTAQAQVYYQKACDGGSQDGCKFLKEMK
jgi:serine/threonine protein kinase